MSRCCRISRVIGMCLTVGAVSIAASARAAPVDDQQTCFKASGDVAIAACARAIATKGFKGRDLAVIVYNRGVEYRNNGDYDRAITDYNEAIRLDPKYAKAYNNRGVSYKIKGDYDRAITDYNEAIRLDPNLAVAYNNRGLAYKYKRDYDRAIADYDEAIRLDPKYANAYSNRAGAYGAKGEEDRALADYDEAARLKKK